MFLKPSHLKVPGKLSTQLTFYYTSTFAALFIVASFALYTSLDALLDNRFDEDMVEDVEEIQEFYEQGGLALVKKEILRETAKPADQENEFFRLYSTNGNLLFSSAGEHWNELTVNPAYFNGKESTEELLIETQQLEQIDYPVRLSYAFIADDVILQTGEVIESKTEIQDMIRHAFLLTLIIIIPLASLVSWWVASKSASSIEVISDAVAQIEKGNFDSHVDIKSNTEEINQLADTFNSMVDRIKSLITEMRDMIDNIAHDLRSPIGRIRAISEDTVINAQSAEDYMKAAENTLGECDRLLLMINTTLDVAEIESGAYSSISKEVDLSVIIAEACELFEPVAHAKNLQFENAIKGHCMVHGNLQNLQRMIANLIDNAIKYTAENGHVKVSLTHENGNCRIQVSDTGIGISASDQYRIFDRFYRCDNSRSQDGCGLGLSFSRAVARQHGGDILLENSTQDMTAFTVLLPG